MQFALGAIEAISNKLHHSTSSSDNPSAATTTDKDLSQGVKDLKLGHHTQVDAAGPSSNVARGEKLTSDQSASARERVAEPGAAAPQDDKAPAVSEEIKAAALDASPTDRAAHNLLVAEIEAKLDPVSAVTGRASTSHTTPGGSATPQSKAIADTAAEVSESAAGLHEDAPAARGLAVPPHVTASGSATPQTKQIAETAAEVSESAATLHEDVPPVPDSVDAVESATSATPSKDTPVPIADEIRAAAPDADADAVRTHEHLISEIEAKVPEAKSETGAPAAWLEKELAAAAPEASPDAIETHKGLLTELEAIVDPVKPSAATPDTPAEGISRVGTPATDSSTLNAKSQLGIETLKRQLANSDPTDASAVVQKEPTAATYNVEDASIVDPVAVEHLKQE